MMQTEDAMLTERLMVDPEILGGKPIIRGTRITVEFILELLGSGVSEEEILQDYPHLTREDLQACLNYAAHSLRNEIYLDLRKAS
jgi:uncharacterized protein (DUF433 family)